MFKKNNISNGALFRSFLHSVEQILKQNIPISPEFEAMISGQGKTKAYLYRFRIIDNPTCPCQEESQTPEHLIHDCRMLDNQRRKLKQQITAKGGNWPTSNMDLVTKHTQAFYEFIKSIDFSLIQ